MGGFGMFVERRHFNKQKPSPDVFRAETTIGAVGLRNWGAIDNDRWLRHYRASGYL